MMGGSLSPAGMCMLMFLMLAHMTGRSTGEMLLSIFEGAFSTGAVVQSHRIQEVNCSAPASARQCFLQEFTNLVAVHAYSAKISLVLSTVAANGSNTTIGASTFGETGAQAANGSLVGPATVSLLAPSTFIPPGELNPSNLSLEWVVRVTPLYV
eukprot:3753399-Pyramimonas_sp.AAC.1